MPRVFYFMLSLVFSRFRAVSFSGSRSCSAAVAAAASVFAFVPPSAAVSVGCASGVDLCVRARFPSASVFSVSSRRPSAFAVRSAALVSSCVAACGLLIVCPAAACPVGLVPSRSASRCFSGRGSGSWASACFAVGLGGAALVCVPAAVVPPVWLVSRGSVVCRSWLGCWWFVPPVAASVSLF